MKIPRASESAGRNEIGQFRVRHGMTKTRFYRAYDAMTARCTNKRNNRYSLYGGRGIKCLWVSFEDFKKDMYESYLEHVKEFGEKNTQIDRIDVDGDYCKENCRWATALEQVLNRRSGTLIITFDGKTMHLCEWADYLGINKTTIWARLKRGWKLEKVLTKNYYGHR